MIPFNPTPPLPPLPPNDAMVPFNASTNPAGAPDAITLIPKKRKDTAGYNYYLDGTSNPY